MTIREELELREKDILAPWAAFSADSKGRKIPEEQCDIRPVFQRDRDRILHSKSFRRLKDKTQVFLSPDGDHYRTRMTHTLEVSQNARTIAKALRLNEDLAEAIALGHDLGHTPFGHAGERALKRVSPDGFKHNEQSLRTVDILEKNGIRPAKDIILITVDGEKEAVEALKAGRINCVVQCSPDLGDEVMKLVQDLKEGKKIPRVTHPDEGAFSDLDDLTDPRVEGF